MRLIMRGYQVFVVFIIVGLCMNQVYAKLSEDRAALLVKHLDLMRELKTTISDNNKDPKNAQASRSASATDVHLSFAQLKNIVDREWEEFFVSHFDLVDTILERERAHADDYYVFYHAQSKEFRVVQDFIREIFEYIQVSEELRSFLFMRFWGDMPDSVDANNFIDEKDTVYNPGNWNDHQPEIAKQLLSVNLSLFGNCHKIADWECTFDYFMTSRSVMFAKAETKNVLDEIFTYFGFNKKYIADVRDLNKIIDTKEGSLFQIFIPWPIVDRCAYLSHEGGVPFRIALPECMFDDAKQRHQSISPILSKYRLGQSYIDSLKNDPEFKNNAIKRGLAPEDIQKYLVNNFDELQARLIFSNDMLLNPYSGVKIYRYATIPDKSMAQFNKRLKDITHNIIQEWLAGHHLSKTIEGTQLETLCRQIDTV